MTHDEFQKEKELIKTLKVGDFFLVKSLDENKDRNTNRAMVRYSNQALEVTQISEAYLTNRITLSLKGAPWNFDFNHIDYYGMTNTLDKDKSPRIKINLPNI